LFVDWADAPCAQSYRATVTNAATNAQLAEKIVTESECRFDNLPAGILCFSTFLAARGLFHV
jgi:hypothetical protein